MTASSARISVVVASCGRARLLTRCLKALAQQRGTAVEVVVVADEPGRDAARAMPFGDRLKIRDQPTPNIAAARNIGIAAAAGDVIAFIDDDAVPEPDWAQTLAAGLASGSDAVTGPVLGRNGISLQWGPIAVDGLGRDRRLLRPDAPLQPDEALKLQGTNMAVRRAVFDRIGGFDTAFSFYLDDADLALRLARSGASSRYLAAARVHHGFAASSRRTEDRVPLSLHDIGASTEVFLRKHAAAKTQDRCLAQLERDQSDRLLRLARRRKIGARKIRQLMESLAAGIEDGRGRTSSTVMPMPKTARFMELMERPAPPMTVLAGWRRNAGSLRAVAAETVANGRPACLFLFELTPRKHRLSFTEGGWWEQTGGLFGPSVRDSARLQFWRFPTRLQVEKQRLSGLLEEE